MLTNFNSGNVIVPGLVMLAAFTSLSAFAAGQRASHSFGGVNDQMTCQFDANTRLGPVHVVATGATVAVAATITGANRQIVDSIGSFGVTNRVEVFHLPTTVNGLRTIEESILFSGIQGVTMNVERLGAGAWSGSVTVSSNNPSIGVLRSANAFCDAHPEPQD